MGVGTSLARATLPPSSGFRGGGEDETHSAGHFGGRQEGCPINPLLAGLLSPIFVAVLEVAVVLIVKLKGLPKRSGTYLVILNVCFAAIGAVATLLYTIAWMISYTKSTGFSAGNAPLFWIFFWGPLGAALGQLIALVIWWFKKPIARPVSLPRIRPCPLCAESITLEATVCLYCGGDVQLPGPTKRLCPRCSRVVRLGNACECGAG